MGAKKTLVEKRGLLLGVARLQRMALKQLMTWQKNFVECLAGHMKAVNLALDMCFL